MHGVRIRKPKQPEKCVDLHMQLAFGQCKLLLREIMCWGAQSDMLDARVNAKDTEIRRLKRLLAARKKTKASAVGVRAAWRARK